MIVNLIFGTIYSAVIAFAAWFLGFKMGQFDARLFGTGDPDAEPPMVPQVGFAVDHEIEEDEDDYWDDDEDASDSKS